MNSYYPTSGHLAGPASGAGPRVALYSHDTMGLGHFRRNLLIAQALSAPPLGARSVLVAGTGAANRFPMPLGVDCVTLPALFKDQNGCYRPRNLDISLPELIRLRGSIIRTVIETYEPDLFIADNVPRGALRELDQALACAHRSRRTVCVLGLRDVLDAPESVRAEWARAGNDEALREYYDSIWVYGDPQIYALGDDLGFPSDIAEKVHYTGYLDQTQRPCETVDDAELVASLRLPPGDVALCLVGGGQDGAELSEAFAQADFPPETTGILLTGPYMPSKAQQRLHHQAAERPWLRVLEFVPEPTRLLRLADRVITMGGYNSVCEVLSFEKPALIVPRVRPRLEQWIRAQRLEQCGLADVVHPDKLSPGVISAWLARKPVSMQTRTRVDLDGLSRLPQLARGLLQPVAVGAAH